MKQYTYLEIVQSVLTAMSDDPITTIESNLTDAAEEVLIIAKDVYFNFVNEVDWKFLRKVTQLTGLSDTTHPTHMTLPVDVGDIEVIKYNVKEAAGDSDQFVEMTYIEDTSEFLAMSHALDSTDTSVDTVADFGGGTIYVRNDKTPEYFTTFDDTYVVFDSYYSTLDTSLPTAKTIVVGYKTPTWNPTDAGKPDLPGHLVQAYLEKLKAVCFSDLQQNTHTIHIAESVATRAGVIRRTSKTSNPRGLNRKPNYGRK